MQMNPGAEPPSDKLRLYAFHCGTERSDWAVFDPFDERVGEKILSPYFFYLVSHPEGWVLIDTGLHRALRTDPRAYLGDMADAFFVERLDESDDVVAKLASVGLEPTDIGHVVQTHLHFDHAGGLQHFPHATIYVQASELPLRVLAARLPARSLPEGRLRPPAAVEGADAATTTSSAMGASCCSRRPATPPGTSR